MDKTFSFTFSDWMKSVRNPQRTVYGEKRDMPKRLQNSCVFKKFEQSKIQCIDVDSLHWFTKYLPAYEKIRNTKKNPEINDEDEDEDFTDDLNQDVHGLHALLKDLFQSNPTVLAEVIQICELSVTKKDYRAYCEAHAAALETARGERIESMPRFTKYRDPTPCPVNLLEEPALEVFIQYIDNSEIYYDMEYSVGNLNCCGPHDRYTEAEILMPLAGEYRNIVVKPSGGQEVNANFGQGLFKPCNVLYKTPFNMLKENSYYAISLRANRYNSPYESLAFKPLVFTLKELTAFQTQFSEVPKVPKQYRVTHPLP